jgi:putative ABC transport system permease protein
MIRSYIRTTFRNFQRNTVTSVINLLGLSLGLASCLVAGLYIKHEVTADLFQEDLHSIYRVTVALKEYSLNGTPYLFGETAEREIPGVRSSLRLSSEQTIVRIRKENYKHEILFSDPTFFSFFTFPLKHGNETKALSGLKQVVLSYEISKKYFGEVNPVGQTIQILLHNVYTEFEITGVTRAAPDYSSIQYDFIIPLENYYENNRQHKDDWGRFFLTTFLMLEPDKLASVEKAMPAFMKTYVKEDKNSEGEPSMRWVLHPLSDHHLSEGFSGSGIKEGRSAKALIVFAGIAGIILLLACFNFMNLTNAQSSRRATEVGIRKVVGAVRGQLIRQFLAEALILGVIAAVLALGLAELSLLIFRDMLEASLSVFDLRHLDVYAGLITVTLIAGLIAGGYPALVLSNLSVLSTFKKYFRIGGNNWITRSVLSVQFGLSIVLIVCAIVMWQQQLYMMNKDLGYNKEQILVVPFSARDTASLNYLKTEIKNLSEIINATKTSSAFTAGNNVAIQKMPDNSRMMIYMVSVDADYFPTVRTEIVKGRAFTDEDQKAGSLIMINETLMKKLNLQDSIGIKLGRTVGWIDNPTIVGVVKDFHHTQLKWEIQPLMLLHDNPLSETFLMVKLAPGQLVSGKENVQALWEKVNADSPFEYFFLDDELNKQYASELRWSEIITLATGMAIFLSMLGLLGLAMYTAERRKKEIGIRKVLGASVRQLVTLLSKDYVWLMALAFAVAVPVSYYVMTNYWLNNFAYRIPIGTAVYI